LYGLIRRFESEYENPTVTGCVFYLDREGQNEPLMFPVDHCDGRIEDASDLANEIRESDELPPLMSTSAKVSRNKTTADSVYLDVPWQCQYCEFRGVSCEGAISEDLEYTNKLGELREDQVVITADVDGDAEAYQRILQSSIDEGRVVEK
jgi:hypothetical protein